MLRPIDTSTRERKSLNGLWRFRADPAGAGRAENWQLGPLSGAREMPVPASFNDVVPDAALHGHVGDVWYQTTVHVPAGWDGQRIVLRFDAATHRADVWVGDTLVASHEGGYTPFEADITDHVRPGEPARISVLVNNELTFASIPPGEVTEGPDGKRTQNYFHDFFNYAGLHRSVWLYATPRTHISGIAVETGLNEGTGSIRYTVEQAGDAEVRVTVRDAEGREVAAGVGGEGTLTIADVRPWAPGEGYLYSLQAGIHAEDGSVIDSYELSVGVRTVRVEGAQLLINGEPFYFQGFGKHEDTPVRGRGYDDVWMVHDFELMRWLGANSFRTAHYPYAEEWLDYADRHGIVVVDECAAVGLNLSQTISPSKFGSKTFSENTVGEATQRTHLQAIRELIERDRNHPSVVMWSIANEPESAAPEARDYFEPLFAEARKLDPTRPLTYAVVMGATAESCQVADLADVLMINRYYGWYTHLEDLAGAAQVLEGELRQWAARHRKPMIMSEYGADTVPGLHSIHGDPWSEEFQTRFLQTYHEVFDRIPEVIGEHIWNFADFATRPGIIRVDGNKKGVFTRDRKPKAAAFSVRERWTARNGEASRKEEA